MANIRLIALRLLENWERDETYLNLALSSPMTRDLSREERGFLTSLLYGTVERKITLDYLINVAAKRSDIDPETRNILRLGFYQLFFMDKIPSFAAVSETVSLAREKGRRGFLNGVLRGALRSFSGGLPLPPREKNLARYLGIAYSYPLPLVRHFLSLLGEEGAESLLSACNRTAPLTVAVNTLKTTREALLARLRECGISAELTERSPIGIRIFTPTPVSALPGFSEGELYVQDEASQLGAQILAPRAGDTVIDPCACPGGKSFAAAIRMEDRGKIYAFDLHESKLPLITESAARLGISSISVCERDAETPDPALLETADAVICDVPCSGLGVLAKKPDLRYQPPERMVSLPPLQASILSATSRYVRLGGKLLYSTCTLNRAENEGVFTSFLEKHTEFRAIPFAVADLSASDGMLTLYPHIHGTDGFFYALAERIR